jgi:hypothetical protein
MSMFDAPSSGGTLKPADINGHLLIVEPIGYETGIVTQFGESDAVRVDVHDITTQETHEGVLWFSNGLVSKLKGSIGKRILAVMGQGVAKPGQSAPWTLLDASTKEEAVAAATDYLNKRTAGTLSAAPATPAAAAEQSEAATLDAALANLSGLVAK